MTPKHKYEIRQDRYFLRLLLPYFSNVSMQVALVLCLDLKMEPIF